MDIKRVEDVPVNAVEVDGASGVQIQWLVGAEDRPEHFYMRLFILQPGGHTPQHDHRWEHEVFVLEGEGTVVTTDGEQRIDRSSVCQMQSLRICWEDWPVWVSAAPTVPSGAMEDLAEMRGGIWEDTPVPVIPVAP